ncbi:uncharacterized protein LOC143124591 [Alosa pseudoharengus]|uniref:uncharacterized protein LOC143124591 n=1 Tax=Alosa pseudoharengus TaxID=34774 RepID=UPI003F8893EC
MLVIIHVMNKMEHYDRQQNGTNWTDGSPGKIRAERVAQIVGWVTFAVGLPAICLAIYMLSQLVKGGNGTPVQAINLLISDIFNLFTRPQTISGSTTAELDTDIPSLIFYFGVASNIVFMVGVAQERHLLVASQRCHGCCRKAKHSSLISLATWAAPIGIVLLLYFGFLLAFSICLLVPFPLLVFFLLDSCRASLCCPTSVRPSQRRRVLAMLVTILLNYSLLFFPFALATLLANLEVQISGYEYFGLAANLMLYLSPVFNPFLTMLLTKSLRELLDTLPCCRHKQTQTADTSVVLENPNVALPLSDTQNSFSVVSGKGSGFPSQGMGMESPNGISTVFENFNATLGMSGTSAQIPTVSGGLSALPNMGMTCGQAPTPFGNLTTIPGLPNMGGMIGSVGPTPLGSQSKDPAMPGLPNMSMICSEGPTSLGNLTQDATMPGAPYTTMSGLQNVGQTFSQIPTPLGNQTRDTTVIVLPIWGLTYSQVPTHLGNLPDNTTMIGIPIVGLICSQNPTHLGNINRDLTTPDMPDTHPSESDITTKL